MKVLEGGGVGWGARLTAQRVRASSATAAAAHAERQLILVSDCWQAICFGMGALGNGGAAI